MYASFFGRLSIAPVFVAAIGLFILSQSAHAEIGAHILVDAKSGAVIDQKNATRKWYPASLTKLMTAYVTFKAIRAEKISLNSAVVQSQNSASEPPSKMGFKIGTKFTVDTALKIILIKSANDVAVALGEAVAGSEAGFIAMMNAEARRLGMTHTRFSNPHGLPDNSQVTTARDMAILAMALRRDFPESREFYNHPGIRFGKKTLRSANREFLLRVKGANGMKTGYICNSGYNVAASVTRRGRTLIGIIMGASSGLERTAFARQLFDAGFKKGRGGKKVTSLSGYSGNPPANGYCRRNKKLSSKQYMARYDMKNTQGGGLLFFGKQKTRNPAKVDTSSFTKSNGKPDWAKILDRTLGPRRIAYKPLPVGLGKPKGTPSVSASIPAENIPLPVANPIRKAKMEMRTKLQTAQTEPAAEVTGASAGTIPQIEAAGQRPGSAVNTSKAAHGSIFRKGMDFTVPVPAPSPSK
ncbi:D-alanyl-D-alanine carboxypeptidase family protein [Labrenzia sp. PHM005]|uniref:D-alanyl-D-alanine carboxypeptidase family protein n=1 Tax=Labrenzia sp. PHM005 TaxID=2590016 RepID=UPI001140752F|nr:D-alanyl-D-alanine carboxypeptidase family protein [Labrenzia sp. PHM005]QDG75273.1 D-alanyl-D-alanine carboxypeptidase [Labrenzia sp. PHM005]